MQRLLEVDDEIIQSGSNDNSRDTVKSRGALGSTGLPELKGPVPGCRGGVKNSRHCLKRYESFDRQGLLLSNPDPFLHRAWYFKAPTIKTSTSHKRRNYHGDAHTFNELTTVLKIQSVMPNPDEYDLLHRIDTEHDDQVMERTTATLQQEAATRRKTVREHSVDFFKEGTKALLQTQRNIPDKVQNCAWLPLTRGIHMGKFKSSRLIQGKPKEPSEYDSETSERQEPSQLRRAAGDKEKEKRGTRNIMPPIEKSCRCSSANYRKQKSGSRLK